MADKLPEVDMEVPVSGGTTEVSLVTGKKYMIRLIPEPNWIEIDLVDELGRPAAGEIYRVELPDGTLVQEDKLDRNGYARVEGFTSEECTISFPRLDLGAWSYQGSSE